MSIRSVNTTSSACAATVASLSEDITVARTDNSTMLFNLPRDIGEVENAAEQSSVLARWAAKLGLRR